MRIFDDLDELLAFGTGPVGISPWHQVTQEQVDLFADATGDHQWIHVDNERAADGPFGGTIAHGYLTVSLIPTLVKQIYRVDGLRLGINYGSNRVRFPSPVRVGARVRAQAQLSDVQLTSRGVLVTTGLTVECDAADKPACVAEVLSLLVGDTAAEHSTEG